MSLRILILSRYDKLGASSRMRTLQYVPKFEALGAQVTVAPLFDDAYLLSLYQSRSWLLNRVSNWNLIVKLYFKRLRIIASSKKFDVVWVEKELFPYLPGIAESLLAKTGIPYVVDYDDAIFHNYDLSRSGIVRALLGHKLKPLLSAAYAVTAGNDYVADYANRNGAKNVVIIPTVVDIDIYRASPEPIDEVLRIGWIGSPSTAQYLGIIAEPLRRVAQSKKIVFVTVGAPALDFPGVPMEQHAWSLDTEAKLLESIHVGVMPLLDSPWERGKSGYKLIQYMACGRPVIASPVGVNTEIATPDVGFLANDDDSWVTALIKLANQPLLRKQLGQAARSCVEQKFALHVTAPKVARLLEDAASGEKCPQFLTPAVPLNEKLCRMD